MPNAPVFCLRLLGTVALELCDDAGQWRSVPLGKSKRAQLLAFVGVSDVPVRRSEVQKTLWSDDSNETNLKELLRRVQRETESDAGGALPKLLFSSDDSPEVPTGQLALNPIWKCDAAEVKRLNKRARKEDDAAKKRRLLERLVATYTSGDDEFGVGLDEDDWVTEARAALTRDYEWAQALLAQTGNPTDDNLGEAENVFVGREALVETVRGWATSTSTEWVLCLHGPGGVGKTRLAREAGRLLRGEFERICLVNLESQSPETVTPALVASALAQALGLSEGLKEPDKELAARVKALNQKVLLILDNFESADTVATQTWLKDFALTGIKCLVTSRKRWTVRNAARNVEVERLVVPSSATEDFDGFPSVQLFRARLAAEVALAAYPQLSPDDQEALVRILQVTEGFPLAIEIVAANLLYWEGTLASLASDLGVKKLAYRHDLDESGGGPERHESMGACFQWSLNLLPDDERERFPRLGVFPYDFSPEAAQEICGVSPEDLQRWWQRSLVQKDTTPHSTRRFLLSLLREYAQDQQSETVRGEVESRFVSYYAQLVESCWWDGRLQMNDDAVRARLDAEWRTILAAQPVALAQGNVEDLLQLMELSDFLSIRGLWLEWATMLEVALGVLRGLQTALSPETHEGLRNSLQQVEGRTLGNLGNVYRQQSRWDDAIECHQQSLFICHALGDRHGEGLTLMNLGNVHREQSRWGDAIKCFQQSLAICHAFGDRHGEGQTLGSLGNVYLQQSRWDDAIECYQKSLIVFRAMNDRYGEDRALMGLGNVYLQQSRWDDAIECYQQGLTICHALGDRHGEGLTLMNLGNVYREQSRWDDATKFFQQSLAIFRALGDRHGEGQTLMSLGNVYLQQNRWDDAIEYFQNSLTMFRALGDRYGESGTLTNLGIVYRRQSRWDDAIECYQQGLTICRALGDRHREGLTLTNLGNVLQQKGQLQEAFTAHTQAAQLMQAIGDVIELGRVLANRALVLANGGMLMEALQDARQAVRILEQKQGRMTLKEARGVLAQIEAAIALSSGGGG